MNGVMTPGVSAGSNHAGASETWTASVSCPSGAAAADGEHDHEREQQHGDDERETRPLHRLPPLSFRSS